MLFKPHKLRRLGVWKLKLRGFAGLYIYPKLLGNPLVYKQLVDTLLHHELANPRNETNLHKQYHVTYPDKLDTAEDHTSIFASDASQLKMQPRLREDQSWMTPSITSREYVDQLRWLTFTDGVPSKIKALFQSILPYKAEHGTAYISSSRDPLHFERDEAEQSALIDVSLGCDGIVVVSLDHSTKADLEEPTTTVPNNQGTDDDWRDLVDGLGSSPDDSTATNSRTSDAEDAQHSDTATKRAPQLAAIHVRSTDVLVFSGRSRGAWHGVAKVLDGSSPPWEQQWPCWGASGDTHTSNSWKGCMKGRRIDLVFQ